MSGGTSAARRWGAALGRAATVAVCLLTLQQCSRPTGSGPTGPSGNGNQPPTTPQPNPSPPGPQTFVGAGDIAICDIGAQEATARLLDGIGGTVFTLGDNAYPNGRAEDFSRCYDPAWGRHKARTRPAPGNHDYNSPGAQPYYDYYGTNAGPSGAGYYSYNLGAWHIIALNSDAGVATGGGQEAWLRQDLAANADSKCTLAYWHHPLFSSGQNGNNPYMRATFRILYENNADLVLTGHDHTYERFAPQDADGRPDPTRGIRQFVVGTGGMVPLYQFTSSQPNSERKETSLTRDPKDHATHGVLKLTLNADSYGYEFITVGRGTLDAGSGTCH
jgi:acid phosphatase type 7